MKHLALFLSLLTALPAVGQSNVVIPPGKLYGYDQGCLNNPGGYVLPEDYGTLTPGAAADSTQMAANRTAINAAIAAAPVGGAMCLPADSLYLTWDDVPHKRDGHIEVTRDSVSIIGAGACGWGTLDGCSYIGTPGDSTSANPYYFNGVPADDSNVMFLRGNGIKFEMRGEPADSIRNITLQGFELDGHSGWTGCYTFSYSFTITANYNCWDGMHKGIHLTGGEEMTGILIEDVKVHHYKGEIIYMGGFDANEITARRVQSYGTNGSSFNIATPKNLVVEDSHFGVASADTTLRVRFWAEFLAEKLDYASMTFRNTTFEACPLGSGCIAIPWQGNTGIAAVGQVYTFEDSSFECIPGGRLFQINSVQQTVNLRRNTVAECGLGFLNSQPSAADGPATLNFEDNTITLTTDPGGSLITPQGDGYYDGRIGGNTITSSVSIPLFGTSGGTRVTGLVIEENTIDGLKSPQRGSNTVPLYRSNTYADGFTHNYDNFFRSSSRIVEPAYEYDYLNYESGDSSFEMRAGSHADGQVVTLVVKEGSGTITFAADSVQHAWTSDLVLGAGDSLRIVYDAALAQWSVDDGEPVVGEAGLLSFSQSGPSQWHPVAFQHQSYSDPIVVAGPPSHNGPRPTTVRIRNVTAAGFEIQLDEWDYLDGSHDQEDLAYLAIEAGTHTLEDGRVVQAGTAVSIGGTPATVAYPTSFSTAPVVVTQAVTAAGQAAVAVRQQAVTTSSFETFLQEQESSTSSPTPETLGWVAIAPGSGSTGGASYEVGRTADAVKQNWYAISFGTVFAAAPAFVAAMQTADGSDTATLRRQLLSSSGVEVFVEEEQSGDSETNHTTEVVGYLAFEPGLILGGNQAAAVISSSDSTDTGRTGIAAPFETADIPAEYALEGSYPNPFNPTATIRFALPEPAHVQLGVYDVLGRRVATLADGAWEAGRHAVRFDAATLPSGLYLYRLEAGPFVATGQMVLAK